MKKLRDLIYSIYVKISDSYWQKLIWEEIVFRINLALAIILTMFTISFCIIGFEETFQHTARIHLELKDQFNLLTRYVKYFFADSLFIELKADLLRFAVWVFDQVKNNPLECSLCLAFLSYVLNILYKDNKK